MQKFRLTDEEILAAAATVPADLPDRILAEEALRVVADTATEKALREVVVYLKGFEAHHLRPEDFIAIGRGHGLDMAAGELEDELEVTL